MKKIPSHAANVVDEIFGKIEVMNISVGMSLGAQTNGSDIGPSIALDTLLPDAKDVPRSAALVFLNVNNAVLSLNGHGYNCCTSV